VAAEGAAAAFGIGYLASKYLLTGQEQTEDYQQMVHAFQITMPALVTVMIGMTAGLEVNFRRFSLLPAEEAGYTDDKIEEFYNH
jgi:hypothetical protein